MKIIYILDDTATLDIRCFCGSPNSTLTQVEPLVYQHRCPDCQDGRHVIVPAVSRDTLTARLRSFFNDPANMDC